MRIREMSNDECLRLLAGARLARLACASDNQPYIVPVYLAFHQLSMDAPCFFGFTTFGQKVEWMRANPQVCVEVDEIQSSSQWTCVVATGRFVELPHSGEPDLGRPPARKSGRDRQEAARDESAESAEWQLAYQLLQDRAAWWEPASTSRVAVADDDAVQSFQPIYFKITLGQLTGREATPDSDPEAMPSSVTGNRGWLQNLIARFIRHPT